MSLIAACSTQPHRPPSTAYQADPHAGIICNMHGRQEGRSLVPPPGWNRSEAEKATMREGGWRVRPLVSPCRDTDL
jgi:hypothetical protein